MICGRCHCHPESEVIARASCRGSVRRRALVIEIPPRSFYFAECQTGPGRLVTFGIRGDAEPDCHAAVRGTIQGRLHNMRGGTRPPFCSRAGGHAAQDRQLRILSDGSPLCRVRDGPDLPRGAWAGSRATYFRACGRQGCGEAPIRSSRQSGDRTAVYRIDPSAWVLPPELSRDDQP